MNPHPLLTDEAVEAAQQGYHGRPSITETEARLAAFIAHHEGERPCERCKGKGWTGQGSCEADRCKPCGGTGKVREDRLVKRSEVVAVLRAPRDDSFRGECQVAATIIEREFGGGR